MIHISSIKLPSLLRKKEVTIRGRDETIFEIPLKNVPERGLVAIEIKDLLHQIVIGPSNRAETIRSRLAEALTKKGIMNAVSRILATDIPLRVEG